MSIGKQLRFEILKRDGFRCTYCGASPNEAELRVDHVVPRAKGGSDEPGNLTTACFDCNAGKSDRELHESRSDVATPVSDMAVRLHNAKALLDAQRELEVIRAALAGEIEMEWEEVVGRTMPTTVKRALKTLVDKNSAEEISSAIASVARASESGRLRDATGRAQYFFGTLKRMREERELLDASPEERRSAAQRLCREALEILSTKKRDVRDSYRAEKLATRAASLDEDSDYAHQLAGCALMDRDLHDAARIRFERAVQLAPKKGVHRFNLALSLGELGRTEAAIEELGQALAMAPGDARAHKLLAELYERAGDLENRDAHLSAADELQAQDSA